MSTLTIEPTTTTAAAQADADVIKVTRHRVDAILISVGVALTAVLLAAGALLTWGSNFAEDYVQRELAAQHISFPDAASLQEEGRDDLVTYADQQVDTGAEAEAYASYINGHLQGVADGATYADLGTDFFAAQAAVEEATDSGAPASEVADLQANLDQITGQRQTLFTGDMLRGSLLSTYAWSTIGRIAGIAATVAFAFAALMLVLVGAGMVHLRRLKRAHT